MNAVGDSCYCLIPSPEPGAAQGTSSIILVLGLMFLPMGLMKGGLPSFRRGALPVSAPQMAGAKVVTPAQIASGGLFALGIVLVLIGVDAVFVPGYLVFKSVQFEVVGAVVAILGALMTIRGLRKPS